MWGRTTCSNRTTCRRTSVEAVGTVLLEAWGVEVREWWWGGDEALLGFDFSTGNDQSFGAWKKQAYFYTFALVSTSTEETMVQGWKNQYWEERGWLEYQDVITEEETDLTTSMWMQRWWNSRRWWRGDATWRSAETIGESSCSTTGSTPTRLWRRQQSRIQRTWKSYRENWLGWGREKHQEEQLELPDDGCYDYGVCSGDLMEVYYNLFPKNDIMDLVYDCGFDIKDVEATTTSSSWRPRTARSTRTVNRKVYIRVRKWTYWLEEVRLCWGLCWKIWDEGLQHWVWQDVHRQGSLSRRKQRGRHSIWLCLLHAGEWFMEDKGERRKEQRELGAEVEVFHGAQRRGCSFSVDKKDGNPTKRLCGEEAVSWWVHGDDDERIRDCYGRRRWQKDQIQRVHGRWITWRATTWRSSTWWKWSTRLWLLTYFAGGRRRSSRSWTRSSTTTADWWDTTWRWRRRRNGYGRISTAKWCSRFRLSRTTWWQSYPRSLWGWRLDKRRRNGDNVWQQRGERKAFQGGWWDRKARTRSSKRNWWDDSTTWTSKRIRRCRHGEPGTTWGVYYPYKFGRTSVVHEHGGWATRWCGSIFKDRYRGSNEASNLALSTNGDDLEVMMRIIRDTAMEAHQQERTPRQRLRIWRRRFRARLEGCGIWQRSLTQAEMRERSRSRTSRASRTTTRRTLAEGEEEEPEAEDSEQGETEQQQIERYRNSSMEEVSDPELWQSIHHWEWWQNVQWLLQESRWQALYSFAESKGSNRLTACC